MSDATCSVPDCTRPRSARGWCKAHYSRWRRSGAAEAPVRNTVCTVDGCGAKLLSRGYCAKHYQRWAKSGDPLSRQLIIGDDEARFWSKLPKADALDCWEWQGNRKPSGYGLFYTEGKVRPAHRVAYELLRGEIGSDPSGKALVLDHLCRNPPCCNPWHLEPVTIAENIRRGDSTSDETCRRGHVRTPENTYYPPRGRGRSCRECGRLSARKYRKT